MKQDSSKTKEKPKLTTIPYICSKLNIHNIEKIKTIKQTEWNINASSEKWENYTKLINLKKEKATEIITDTSKSINQRYKHWYNEIESAARQSIGKTTFKQRDGQKFSAEINTLKHKKKSVKTEIKLEKNTEKRNVLNKKQRNSERNKRRNGERKDSIH